MSGFSVDWLRMREPYDHAARSTTLVAALRDALPSERPVELLELAVGRGSGPRFVAPLLPMEQHWTVVDHDPALLSALVQSIPGGPLQHHQVQTLQMDLLDLERLGTPADAVLTQALLDLVSHEWLVQFADWLAVRRVPLLASLTVDGRIEWDPPMSLDDEVHAAFRAHQLWDRGFGASPGYRAASELADLLSARGFSVTIERTDWQISEVDTSMLREMAHGISTAAEEAAHEGETTADQVRVWLEERLAAIAAQSVSLKVGHIDLLAIP